MTKFQQRCSVLSVLVPALGLAGCMASPDDVARVAQPISEADGGVADGSAGDGSASPFIEAPRPPTVRTARDVAAFLDRVARRSRLGGGQRQNRARGRLADGAGAAHAAPETDVGVDV